MATVPHDLSDLYLAPVVLAIDARIEELGDLDLEELAREVALAGDTPDWTSELRESGLVQTVRHLIPCRGWDLAWDRRGIRVAHGDRHIVLGVSPTFVEYVSGVAYSGHVSPT